MPKLSSEKLSEMINDELKQNRQLAVYGLKARVYENGTVQIQGIVDVLDEKSQVEELLWRFPGVKKIENDITVCTDGGIDDEDVAFEVSEELQANPEIPDSVGVRVSGGEAQLVGTVKNYHEMITASETAGKARGVREVNNQLKLAAEIDDVSIINSIQTALINELHLAPGKVKISCHEGIVTLRGELPERKMELVVATASRQPGVRGIKNELTKTTIELDDQIVVEVMGRIADNPYLSEQPIGIEVEEGKIILTGSIDSLEAKKDIEDIIHEIAAEFKPDIFAIDNKLRLDVE